MCSLDSTAQIAGYAGAFVDAINALLASKGVATSCSIIVDMATNEFGRAIDSSGQVSVTSLWRPKDGLLSRVDLIENAQVTIDAQYYEWTSDRVGTYLLDRALRAADRGVHVRLLVDDLHIGSRTRAIASLRVHKSVEVRVYNPWQRHALLQE